jgi:membrane protein
MRGGRWPARIRLYAARTLTLGGLNRKHLAIQVWKRIHQDNVFGRAAQLSYYFVLALFPLLIFLSTLLGYLFAAERGIYFRLLHYLGRVMPQSSFDLLRSTLDEISQTTGTGKLTLGLALTLWTASSGMEAIIEGLNVAYAVDELRPRWRRRLVAIGLTIAVGGLVAMALFLMLASDAVARSLGVYVPLLERIDAWSNFVQWAIGLCFLLLALSLIFRFAPNLRHPRWEANLPGAVLTLIFWVLASAGLKLYLSLVATLSRTYGSLGAMIALLIWLHLSGAALLIGGELNSVIWQAVLRARRRPAISLAGTEEMAQ